MSSITSQSAPCYRFADLALDVGRCRVARGEETIPLSRLSFELLRALVASAPNVVRYDDAAKVWGPRRIVTPENLAKRVMLLRQALGDDAEQPRYIEGIRGLGYRLIPEVETYSPQLRDGTSTGGEVAPSSSPDPGIVGPDRGQARGGPRLGYAATTALAIALVWATLLAFRDSAPATDRAVARLLLDVRPAERLGWSVWGPRPSRTAMALSPDGGTVVFAAFSGSRLKLYKRRIDEDEAVPMPGTEGGVAPFFSPDGAWVGFWANGKLRKVSLDGGPVVDVVDVYLPFGAAWGPDDTIVFSAGWDKGIARVATTGDGIQTVIHGSPGTMQMLPRILPGNHAMLYTQFSNHETSIRVHRFDTGENRTLVEDGADARLSPSGHLLFMRRGVLMAAPFDAERATLTGAPVAVVDDVMHAIAAPNFGDETRAGQFDVAENGTLVYITGGLYPWDTTDAYWVDQSASAARIPIEGPIVQPRVSPDGTRIAFTAQRSATSRDSDIWVYDIERETSTRLTHEGSNFYPVWSPDSRNLAFGHTTVSGESYLALVLADGSHPAVPVTRLPSEGLVWPSWWSAVNETLVLVSAELDDFEIWMLDMAASGEPKHEREAKLFLDGPSIDTHPAFSPDGRWLAYASHDTGKREVYVQRYPEGGQKVRISTDGGFAPIWAPDGRQLFYWQGATLPKQVVAVDFDAAGESPIIGAPRLLFEPNEYQNSEPVRGWDLSPDGQKFVLIKGEPEAPVMQMHVVVNWTAELERRVPVD